MENKTCGECKWFVLDGSGFCRSNEGNECRGNDACSFFDPKVITNGDVIRQGGNRELAKCMVYGYRVTDDNGELVDGMLYTWKHPQAKVFDEYNRAVDYLEAWLNAPAESEVSNG